jgi:hypothetical protein
MDKDTVDLTRKALFGLVQLVIVLGLLLFVSAGSLDFWEAWVFLFVFSISVLAITLYFLKNDMKLIEGRLKAGPSAEKEKKQKIIQTFARTESHINWPLCIRSAPYVHRCTADVMFCSSCAWFMVGRSFCLPDVCCNCLETP